MTVAVQRVEPIDGGDRAERIVVGTVAKKRGMVVAVVTYHMSSNGRTLTATSPGAVGQESVYGRE